MMSQMMTESLMVDYIK